MVPAPVPHIPGSSSRMRAQVLCITLMASVGGGSSCSGFGTPCSATAPAPARSTSSRLD